MSTAPTTEGLPEELRQTSPLLVGVLGRGGMGTVYKAVHRLLDRAVVLKIIRPELVATALTWRSGSQREARLAARLSAPERRRRLRGRGVRPHRRCSSWSSSKGSRSPNWSESVVCCRAAESHELIRQAAAGY